MEMEIGIWIHTGHFAAGGPTAVIIGVLIGIKKLLPNAIILINEPGLFNIQLFGIYQDVRMYPKNTIFGPNPIPLCYVGMNEPTDDKIWSYGKHLTFSAMWVINWLEQKFPIRQAFYDKTKILLDLPPVSTSKNCPLLHLRLLCRGNGSSLSMG
jgi:hypothetical protein